MLAHTRRAGANPLGAGQFVGSDSERPAQAFYGHVPRPSRLGFFPPPEEDFGTISLAFPRRFQSKQHGVPQPASARRQRAGGRARFPGDAPGRLHSERGAVWDGQPPAPRDAGSAQTKPPPRSKQLRRRQHLAATRTTPAPRQELTANTRVARCYLYHTAQTRYTRGQLHHAAAGRAEEGEGRSGAACSGHAPAQPVPLRILLC